MRKPYKTDLTDAQWKTITPLIPPAKPGGRPREVDMREILNTLLYQARTGCQRELLPHDLPPKSTVSDFFAQWRDDGTGQRITDALRRKVRVEEGRGPTPQRRLDRQPVGQDHRGRRRAGLRRGQERQWEEAARRGGYLGVADGGGRDGGLGRRRGDGAAGAGATGSVAVPPAGSGLRRSEVQEPRARRMAGGAQEAVPGRGREASRRDEGIRAPAEALGVGAQLRVVGS